MQWVKKIINLGLMISDIVFRAKRAQPSVFSKRLRAMWGAMAMTACVNQLSLLYYQRRWDYVPYYQPPVAPLLASDYKCECERSVAIPNGENVREPVAQH